LDGSVGLEELLRVCHARGVKLGGRAPNSTGDVQAFIAQHPGWHRFDVVNDIIGGDAATLRYVSEAFVGFQARCGVAYTEVRYDPIRLARSSLLNVSISEEDAVRAVQEGLSAGAAHHNVSVHQILCAMRGKSDARCRETARLAAKLRDGRMGGVVGLDLAGDESHFRNQLYVGCLRYAKRALGLNTTVHSGEFNDTAAEEVRIAVEDMEVDRIGHGYAAAQDPAVLQLLRARRVHVEACPKSALMHGPREFAALEAFKSEGVSFGLNTDDPASFMGNTTAQADEAIVRRFLGFSAEDVAKAYEAAYAARFSREASGGLEAPRVLLA